MPTDWRGREVVHVEVEKFTPSKHPGLMVLMFFGSLAILHDLLVMLGIM